MEKSDKQTSKTTMKQQHTNKTMKQQKQNNFPLSQCCKLKFFLFLGKFTVTPDFVILIDSDSQAETAMHVSTSKEMGHIPVTKLALLQV